MTHATEKKQDLPPDLPSIIEEKPSAAIEIGQLFSQERERRKLTIEDVSKELHIRQLYLRCIEKGDLEKLPGYVYVVGFIKSYAKFLELDCTEIFRQLSFEQIQQPSPLVYAVPIHKQQSPSLKILFASATLLIIFGFLIYIAQHVDFKATENSLLSLTPKKLIALEESDPLKDILLPSEVAIKKEVTLEDPSASPVVDISSQEVVLPVKETTTPETSTSLSSSAAIPTTEEDTIQVIALKDSWVQILDDQGKNIFVRLMHKGETFDLPKIKKNQKPYTLNTGNGGGVKFLVNGTPTLPLDADGKVVRDVALSVENLKKWIKIEEPKRDGD